MFQLVTSYLLYNLIFHKLSIKVFGFLCANIWENTTFWKIPTCECLCFCWSSACQTVLTDESPTAAGQRCVPFAAVHQSRLWLLVFISRQPCRWPCRVRSANASSELFMSTSFPPFTCLPFDAMGFILHTQYEAGFCTPAVPNAPTSSAAPIQTPNLFASTWIQGEKMVENVKAAKISWALGWISFFFVILKTFMVIWIVKELLIVQIVLWIQFNVVLPRFWQVKII